MTDKAMFGRMTCVRAGCLEGRAEQAERPAGLGEAVGSQSLHITAMPPMAVERGG
jgi:hypothetical protein